MIPVRSRREVVIIYPDQWPWGIPCQLLKAAQIGPDFNRKQSRQRMPDFTNLEGLGDGFSMVLNGKIQVEPKKQGWIKPLKYPDYVQ